MFAIRTSSNFIHVITIHVVIRFDRDSNALRPSAERFDMEEHIPVYLHPYVYFVPRSCGAEKKDSAFHFEILVNTIVI